MLPTLHEANPDSVNFCFNFDDQKLLRFLYFVCYKMKSPLGIFTTKNNVIPDSNKLSVFYEYRKNL